MIRSSNAISKSVPTEGRISARIDFLDRQAGEKDRICFITKDHGKILIQKKYSIADQRRTKGTRWGRILFIPEYNRSIKSATLYKELENTMGRHRKGITHSNGMEPI